MKKLYLIVCLTALATGCAHGPTERQVDSKLASHPDLEHHGDLDAAAQEHIENTPGLSTAQKTELTALRERTHSEMEELNQNSLKLKSLAIANATSTKGSHAELESIKKRIRKLEERKVEAFFKAIDSSLRIIDREPESRATIHRDWIFRDMLLERRAPSI